jgi:hypothetical protein
VVVPLPDGDQSLARRKQPIERPIATSKKARKRLLEPGYWGYLEEEEVEFIQAALHENPDLSSAWGFQPVQKPRSPAAIRRVAMWGDPKNREVNTKLIRGNCPKASN